MPQFNGWFDDILGNYAVPPSAGGGSSGPSWWETLLNTGIKTIPPLLAQPSGPHSAGPLTDSGAVSAAIDQIAAQQHALEAQIGIADSNQLYSQMQALQAALNNPQFFDQTSKNQAAAYLQQAKEYMAHNMPLILARLQGQQTVVTTDPVTGAIITTGVPIAGAVSELIPGIPNVYLFGGALALTALLLLKK